MWALYGGSLQESLERVNPSDPPVRGHTVRRSLSALPNRSAYPDRGSPLPPKKFLHEKRKKKPQSVNPIPHESFLILFSYTD